MFAATFAAALLAATSTGAPVAAPTSAPMPAPTAAPLPATSRAADPRVCVVAPITGSHIPYKECMKLSEWRAEGIDPLAKHR